MAKTGVLLVNIGSPERPATKEVSVYLKKFLMDKRVIDIPFLWRWLLVHVLIVPRRAPISALNYKKIWFHDVDLAPLTFYTRGLMDGLGRTLGSEFVVRFGMAYASPSVGEAFADLQSQGCEEILVVPLFPQYADATTGSVTDEVQKLQARGVVKAKIKMMPPFYRDAGFVQALAEVARKKLQGHEVDHTLFSFHGLPEKQILQDKTCHLNGECCHSEQALQKNCYRAQCFKTAELIAKKLELNPGQWSVCFQSRLGRAEWLRPYTNKVLVGLAQGGKRRVAVLSPSFVSDCLETLEELGIQAKEIFLEHGGTEFHLIPCVNTEPEWIQSFAAWIQTTASNNF